MTKRSRKALIIGAGIAGPITAILLKRAGIEAQVFEAWPPSTGMAAEFRSRRTACMCSPRQASPPN